MAAKFGELQLSKVDAKTSDSHLDFSSIYDGIQGSCPGLQSNILDVIVLLLQSVNKDNQTQSIHNAVRGITELYLRVKPYISNPDWEVRSEDVEDYDVEDMYDAEDFLWILWEVLLDIVVMIPYNHPNQELLVNFLKVLRRKKVGIVTSWLVRVPYLLPSHKIIGIFKFMVELIQNLF
jgi:hypothetical protein